MVNSGTGSAVLSLWAKWTMVESAHQYRRPRQTLPVCGADFTGSKIQYPSQKFTHYNNVTKSIHKHCYSFQQSSSQYTSCFLCIYNQIPLNYIKQYYKYYYSYLYSFIGICMEPDDIMLGVHRTSTLCFYTKNFSSSIQSSCSVSILTGSWQVIRVWKPVIP